jgi:hypothetical protein
MTIVQTVPTTSFVGAVLVLLFILAGIHTNLKHVKRTIKQYYIQTLNDRAEEVLRVLYEELKKFPDRLQWPQDVRDSFNRALGGAYHDGVNLTTGKERRQAQHCLCIANDYFATLPQDVRVDIFNEPITDFLLFVEDVRALKNGTSSFMIELISGNNDEFERKYEKCLEAISNI